MHGTLITFEGGDGSGKSTIVGMVWDALTGRDRKVMIVKEPGYTALGSKLREYLLDNSKRPIPNELELTLIELDRGLLYHEAIIPALQAGWIVLSDRGPFGSIAYQGYGRGMSIEEIDNYSNVMTQSTIPDLTLVFDVSLNVATSRIKNRGGYDMKKNPFEQDDDFRQQVFEGFRYCAKAYSYARLINANNSIKIVFADAMVHINKLLSQT